MYLAFLCNERTQTLSRKTLPLVGVCVNRIGKVALSRRANQRSHRRETDEEIQLQRAGLLMQLPRTAGLPRHHAVEPLGGLVAQQAILNDPGGVNKALQR